MGGLSLHSASLLALSFRSPWANRGLQCEDDIKNCKEICTTGILRTCPWKASMH